MKRDPLSVLFHRFAGREVPMAGNRDVAYPTEEGNQLLDEMRATARRSGLSLRILWPGMMATKDYRADRVTVYIYKDEYGKCRIGRDFSHG